MKQKPLLYFRADGNLSIGYGHVIRSLALADIVNNKFDCRFIISQPDDFLKQEIRKSCTIIETPSFPSVEEEAQYLTNTILQFSDFVILDGYKFSSAYQRIIRSKCEKLICIDDIYKEHFYADAVINHAEGVFRKQYRSEWYTQFFLGARYAILRKPFLIGSQPDLNKRKRNVFINLGGTDQKNYTKKALAQVEGLKNIEGVTIVVGALYPFKEELLHLIKEKPKLNISLHINVTAEQMAKLMKNSFIGICSASSIAFEYASVGGMLFLYKTASNQKNVFSFLTEKEIGYPVELLKEKTGYFKSKTKLTKYQKNKASYFSGQSRENLRKIFDKLLLEANIQVKKATEKELKLYFRWANDPEVRRNSINQQSIPLEAHTRWFKAKLASSSTFMYLFSQGRTAIGQVRMELSSNGTAEVNFSLDEKSRGKGYSEIILRKAIFAFKEEYNKDVVVTAVVKPNNIPSLKSFLNNGFKRKKDVLIKGELYCKLMLK